MSIEGLSILAETPLRVDCAWCGVAISAGREPVSHGICRPCLRQELLDLGKTAEEVEAQLAQVIEEAGR